MMDCREDTILIDVQKTLLVVYVVPFRETTYEVKGGTVRELLQGGCTQHGYIPLHFYSDQEVINPLLTGEGSLHPSAGGRCVCVCVCASSHVGSRQGSLHSLSSVHKSGVKGCKAIGGSRCPTSTNWWKTPIATELSISAQVFKKNPATSLYCLNMISLSRRTFCNATLHPPDTSSTFQTSNARISLLGGAQGLGRCEIGVSMHNEKPYQKLNRSSPI